jgi:APA family basic amino acid/polyamine antiporter
MRSNKIGFWSILAIVIGSQVGSGVFVLPGQLALYGYNSIYAILIASYGALCLALVFANLCFRFPQTGGPHVYVQKVLGNSLAFFTGWTYWVVSWVSSLAVVIVAVTSLSPLIGNNPDVIFLLEASLLIFITFLNTKGVDNSSKAEFVLTLIKVIPLLLIPCLAFINFEADNFIPLVNDFNFFEIIIFGLWGFIGIEAATTPAENVINPKRNIPLAILIGTTIVAIIYIVNTVGIIGAISPLNLVNNQSPYADVAGNLFGGNWQIIIAILISTICIGTLNAWVLAGGQIALGCSNDKLFPKLLGKTNKHGAPYIALIISAFISIILLYLVKEEGFKDQLAYLIEVSVVVFLYTYLICCVCYVIVLYKEKAKLVRYYIAFIGLVFCSGIILFTPVKILLSAFAFVLSGLPIYFYKKYKVTKI